MDPSQGPLWTGPGTTKPSWESHGVAPRTPKSEDPLIPPTDQHWDRQTWGAPLTGTLPRTPRPRLAPAGHLWGPSTLGDPQLWGCPDLCLPPSPPNLGDPKAGDTQGFPSWWGRVGGDTVWGSLP